MLAPCDAEPPSKRRTGRSLANATLAVNHKNAAARMFLARPSPTATRAGRVPRNEVSRRTVRVARPTWPRCEWVDQLCLGLAVSTPLKKSLPIAQV